MCTSSRVTPHVPVLSDRMPPSTFITWMQVAPRLLRNGHWRKRSSGNKASSITPSTALDQGLCFDELPENRGSLLRTPTGTAYKSDFHRCVTLLRRCESGFDYGQTRS